MEINLLASNTVEFFDLTPDMLMENLTFIELIEMYRITVTTKLFWFLLICIIIDTVLGIVLAFHKCDLDSRQGIKGLIRNFSIYFVSVLIGGIFIGSNVSVGIIAPVLFFITFTLISILESLHALGVPIPQSWIKRLRRTKDSFVGEEITVHSTTIKKYVSERTIDDRIDEIEGKEK